MKKLSFGLLLDSFCLKNWQMESIRALLELEQLSLELIILNDGKSSFKANKLPLGFRFLERQSRKSHLFQSQNYKAFFSSFELIKVSPIRQKNRNLFATKDLEKIKSYELDFVLRFGFGILSGEILKLPKYGIWSYHHGDPRHYRGGPPVFWEIYNKSKSMGLILQKLGEELDAGEVLLEGKLACLGHSYQASLSKHFQVGIEFPAIVAKRIISQNGKLTSYQIDEKGPIYKVPGNATLLRFYGKQFMAKIRFHLWGLFRAEVWNVGLTKKLKIKGNIAYPEDIKWLADSPAGEYLADPIWSDNTQMLYAEKYSYKEGKAHIVAIEVEGNQAKKQSRLNVDDQHLSYPFFLKYEGKSYLLPENYKSNQLRLFELENQRIIAKHKLLDGAWVDPTLFEHQGMWYLFVSPQAYSNERLDLFVASNPLGPFAPHPHNPIKIDLGNARSAGPLFVDEVGKIIRPAQNSIEGYGVSINFNEILELSPTAYREKKSLEIHPDPKSDYPLGLHTIHKKGGLYLIDGKKISFVWQSFWFNFKRKLNRITGND